MVRKMLKRKWMALQLHFKIVLFLGAGFFLNLNKFTVEVKNQMNKNKNSSKRLTPMNVGTCSGSIHKSEINNFKLFVWL